MPEIGTSGSMSGMGNGALPNGPSYRAHPRLYISEVATPLIEVRSAGHSGLDLLTLSSSHFVKGFGCRPLEGRHRMFGGRRPKASKEGNRA